VERTRIAISQRGHAGRATGPSPRRQLPGVELGPAVASHDADCGKVSHMPALPLALGALLGAGLGSLYAVALRRGDFYELGDALLVMGFAGACVGALIGLGVSIYRRR
jgi:hypothetical protein